MMRKLLLLISCIFLIPSLAFGAASRDLDGTNDKISFGNSSSLDLTGDWTYSIWIKRDVDNEEHGVFSKFSSPSTGRQIYITVESAKQVRVDVPYIKTILRSGVGNTISAGVWTYLSVTKSGTTWKIYFNGVEKNSAVDATAQESSTQNTEIGYDNGNVTPSLYFDGKVSYSKIYNRALSVNEINEDMINPGSVANGVVNFSPLWGDSPEVDLSGNGNVGTVTEATTSTDGPTVMFGGGLPL